MFVDSEESTAQPEQFSSFHKIINIAKFRQINSQKNASNGD
jgi:hypothetical protein